MTDVSVVILNYNGRELLEKFLGEVIQHSNDAHIVVADNGSTDASIQWVESTYPQVEIIRIQKNLGFCGGYNVAMQNINTPYAVLLNSDVQVTENWLGPVLRIMREQPNVAAAQPKILSYHNRNRFEYAGAAGGFVDSLGYPFCRGRIFDCTEEDTHQYDDTRPVFWATGACLFVRSDLFRDLGGFDEKFFAHMEEIDLCWRFRRRGMDIMYCGESTIYHVGGATLSTGSPRKVYYNFRNGLFLILKHLSPSDLAWKLPVRILLDWLAAFVFLFGFPRASWSVLHAHLAALSSTPSVWATRKRLNRETPSFQVAEIWGGSIVWRYFVSGKKTFRDLIS